MTRRRWIADEFSENQAALPGAHAEHLIRVLRARVGQEFDISAGTNWRPPRTDHQHSEKAGWNLNWEQVVQRS